MPLDLSHLVPEYEKGIDSIIEAMGKDCRLIFDAKIVNPTESSIDPLRDGSRRPLYQNDAPIPIEEPETKIIRALITHGPSDYRSFGLKVEEPQDVIKIKTYITYLPDLKRCRYLIPDINVEAYTGAKYRLIREPIPRGLKNNRYCISWWTRV